MGPISGSVMRVSSLSTGDIVTVHVPGNRHDGARCVYIGPWDDREGHTYHFVCHLHDSPTRSNRGLLWYAKGQQSGWDIENLRPFGAKAFFCGGCQQWLEGSLDYLCESCREKE